MRKAICVILVSTLFFISCYNEDMNEDTEIDLFAGDNPFVGTWICLDELCPAIFVFTETEIKRHGKDGTGEYRTNPDFIWTYELHETVLRTLTEKDYNGTTKNLITDHPYNFSQNNIFVLDSINELKKISLKTSFP